MDIGLTSRSVGALLGTLLLLALTRPLAAGESEVLDLAGTGWQLVKIQSMDDSEHLPEERTLYTLAFGRDETLAVRADCNRGTARWSAGGESPLRFSAIATTRALCEPGSLSATFLAQLEWVRSYVYRRDHLYLATMADGSIIEFEPLATGDVVARVLGLSLVSADAEEVIRSVLGRLLDQFAREQQIDATDEEVAASLDLMDRRLREDLGEAHDTGEDLSPEERSRLQSMRHAMAASVIRHWKTNQALYTRYGGRIIYQQLGPEPLDAYRDFLQEAAARGTFTLLDPALEAAFWGYFTEASRHDFMPPGSEEEKRAFEVPPWQEQARQGSGTPDPARSGRDR